MDIVKKRKPIADIIGSKLSWKERGSNPAVILGNRPQ